MTDFTAPLPSQLLSYAGQPISAEGAEARRNELMAGDVGKAAVAGDADAARMLSDLWQLARGRQPGANVPQDVAGVMAQQGERELADQRRVLDTWRGHMRLNDLGAFQLERGEAKESEIAEARREIARLKKDGEFTRKLTAGGAAEIDLWSRMHKVGFGMRAIPG